MAICAWFGELIDMMRFSRIDSLCRRFEVTSNKFWFEQSHWTDGAFQANGRLTLAGTRPFVCPTAIVTRINLSIVAWTASEHRRQLACCQSSEGLSLAEKRNMLHCLYPIEGFNNSVLRGPEASCFVSGIYTNYGILQVWFSFGIYTRKVTSARGLRWSKYPFNIVRILILSVFLNEHWNKNWMHYVMFW